VGTIAGSFVAAFIAEQYNWRTSFVIFGVLGMLLGVVLFFTLREPPRGASEEGGPPTQQRMRSREALMLVFQTPALFFFMLAFAFANAGATVLLAWMAEYVGIKFHLRLTWAGLGASGPSQLASLVGAPLGGWLADSWRSRRTNGRALVQALAVFACAPCMYFCGHTESIVLFSFSDRLGIFKGFYDANIFASVFDIVPPPLGALSQVT
jgi:Sugar phosphate permease